MNKKILKIWKELSNEMRPKIRYWLPAAAVDEADLRAELGLLKERGFGGVEVVDFLLADDKLPESRDGWGTENWDKVIDIIADETKKLGMTMDVAVGPGWPIGTPSVKSAEDPAALCELTFGELTMEGGQIYDGTLPERRTVRAEGTQVLIAAMAYREVRNGTLQAESYIDLMPYCKNGKLCMEFPGMPGEFWKVFAFYRQPVCQKINGGQTYVIDHLSLAGTKAVTDYWEPILEKNKYPSMESIFCDSLEYNVAMDWTAEFPQIFEKICGYSILKYLPVLGYANLYPACDLPGYQFADDTFSEMINHDYGRVLTECYVKNHLEVMEAFAEKYGKTIRYQVAYNKAFEIERSALAVGIPENEALGRPAIDSMKVMAGAAHLGRKKRYSFECAAEFGPCYGQSYEDLFWWVKRSLMAGMNAQVLHGASYSGAYHGDVSENGHLPGVQWPGFEAFGKVVSNNWNRTLSVKDAKGCLDAITRLNTIFRNQAKVDCAVYREDFTNDGLGDEFFIYGDNGALNNAGYSYDFVTAELLKLSTAQVKNGRLDPEGTAYKCLIVPQMKYIKLEFMKLAEQLIKNGLPVIFQGKKPKIPTYYSDICKNEETGQLKHFKEWEETLEKVWKSAEHVEQLEEIPDKLKQLGIYAEVSLDGSQDIMTVTCKGKSGEKYFGLYRYNRVKFSPEDPNPDEMAVSALYKKGTTKSSYVRPGKVSRKAAELTIRGEGTVSFCDYWTGEVYPLDFVADGKGNMTGKVELEEDQMIVLMMDLDSEKINGRKISEDDVSLVFHKLTLEEFGPDTEGETSFLRSSYKEEKKIFGFRELSQLKSWRELDPSLEHFVGRGIYSGEIIINSEQENARYVLELGNVCDTFHVKINGEEAHFPDQVLKQVDITELLHSGKNTVEVTVTSNLYQKFFYNGFTCMGMPVPYVPKDYGIIYSENNRPGVYVY